jgi:hypothetical protein
MSLNDFVNKKIEFYADKLTALTKEEQDVYMKENLYSSYLEKVDPGKSNLNEHAAGELRFYIALQHVLGGNLAHYHVGMIDAVNDMLQELGVISSNETFYKTDANYKSLSLNNVSVPSVMKSLAEKGLSNAGDPQKLVKLAEFNSAKVDFYCAVNAVTDGASSDWAEYKCSAFQVGMLDALNDTLRELKVVDPKEVFYRDINLLD